MTITWDEERVAKLVALRAEGLVYSEIALRFGVSRNSVISTMRRRRLRNGTPVVPRAISHEHSGRVDPEVVAAQRAKIPQIDSRSLTGIIFGDPNPADTRRVWRA